MRWRAQDQELRGLNHRGNEVRHRKRGIVASIGFKCRAVPAFLYHIGSWEGHSCHLLYIRHFGGVICSMIRVLNQAFDALTYAYLNPGVCGMPAQQNPKSKVPT